MKTKSKEYSGILIQPLNTRDPEDVHLKNITDRMDALLVHYGITDNDWNSLALKLAHEHVPGFQFKRRTSHPIGGEPPTDEQVKRWQWDLSYANTEAFLRSRDFDWLFLLIRIAADKDAAFRDELISCVEKLKPDGRRPWTDVERHMLVIHYANAVLGGESDPTEWLCGYVERVWRRTRPSRRTMVNELSKACARIDLNSLHDSVRPIVENRIKAGDVKHKRTSQPRIKGARTIRIRR